MTTKELGTLTTIASLEYEYDANGRVVKYTDENSNVIEYSYYPNGELYQLTYPGNKVVEYTYNGSSQLETVKDWNNNVTTYAYNSNGELSSMTRANGTVESYTYFKNGWLESKIDKDSSNNIISEFNYIYDSVGNILTENGNDANITNVYDNLYELNQQVKKDDAQTLLNHYSYTYDSEGNILTRSDENGIVDTLTYIDGNILSTYNTSSVVYDDDGNMTISPLNGTMETYNYNTRNQLTSVGDHEYTYDASGNRLSVKAGTEVTEFVVNPLAGYNQVLIKTSPLDVDTYYVYGLGLISEETSSNQKYYHFDNRGSTIVVTDSTETITDTFEYGPYGELVSRTGTSDINFNYNGRFGVYTDQNNLVFMLTRYYNPDIRRFVNQDSVLGSLSPTLSLNQYAFTQGNPTNYLDPLGMSPFMDDNTINGSDWEYTGYENEDKALGTMENDNYFFRYHEGYEPDDMFPENITSELTYEETVRALLYYDGYNQDNNVYLNAKLSGLVILATTAFNLGRMKYNQSKVINQPREYTKSTLKIGQEMHKAYKVEEANGITKFKEFRLPSGKRVDYIDFDNRIIYELKPYNPRQIRAGTIQLQGYLEEVQSHYSGDWSTMLDTY